MKNKFFIYLIFLFASSFTWAQTNNLSINFDNESLEQCLLKIEQQENIKFYFDKTWFAPYTTKNFTKKFNDSNIISVLDYLFSETEINYYLKGAEIILTQNIAIHDDFETPIDTKEIVLLSPKTQLKTQEQIISNSKTPAITYLTLGKATSNKIKKKIILSGTIKNSDTDENLEGIVVSTPKRNTYTDYNGNFAIELDYGLNTVELKSVNFENKIYKLTIYNSTNYNFNLKEKLSLLNEIILTKNRTVDINSSTTGKINYDSEEIKNIPVILGERDVIKVATSMPGIKTAGEGSAGINVRGGKSDQNLFLLDNATIYNPSHLFGLFSSINPYIVDQVEIYKSSLPVDKGSRLSSVFDISTKNKFENKITGEGSIGPVTSNLMVQTPIIKDKSNVMVAGRSTYSKWILKSLDNEDLKNANASFYDLYAKYTHKINAKNTLTTSAYYSNDLFNISRDSINSYNNSFVAINWTKSIDSITKLQTDYSYSNYKFKLDYNAVFNDSFQYSFRLSEHKINAKIDKKLSEKLKYSYGINSKLYLLKPGEISPNDDQSTIQNRSLQHEKGLESSLFLASVYHLNDKLEISTGFRFSNFLALGEKKVNIYAPNQPKSESSIIDTENYNNNDVIKSYFGFEPRVSFSYSFTRNLSIKGSFDRTKQYIHLLSTNTTQSPLDTWKISDNYVKPQVANQYSLGLYSSIFNNKFGFSIESYYKSISNILDYKTGADLFMNEIIEAELINGKGKAYGIEFLLKKNTGKLNGTIGYTYSRTFIRLMSQFQQERVNNGDYYPANFDKPHDLNAFLNYKFTKRFNISANFVYQTGRPITFPLGRYNYGGNQYTFYSDRNTFRIPDYYRLDIGLNLEGNHKKNKIAHSFWSLSVYNLLGRNNPYSIYFINEQGRIKAYKTSIFSIPIPTLSYNFKF
ncbi:carboxypeptidase-like regulatory domain-containing protein [Flavobacterium sp. J27]|uniref:TonB-dependent receptor n=1 Tax=Flavobacterium sp. J27 TaxID=2060419 RepID=UPI0013EE50C6|nr:carboxypeptidase-like regulatory domain-containing protein [Flavobacterium sp. J27]